MRKIFISYRRADSQYVAGQLADRLAYHFGRSNLFIDVDKLGAGTDSSEAIAEAIDESGGMLTIVGPHWMDPPPGGEQPRVARGSDPVRIEITQALEKGLPVLPVLVEGADMPAADALPDELAAWSRRHAAEVTNRRFEKDVDDLIKTVEQMLGLEPHPEPGAGPSLAQPVHGTIDPAAAAEQTFGRPSPTADPGPDTGVAAAAPGPSGVPLDASAQRLIRSLIRQGLPESRGMEVMGAADPQTGESFEAASLGFLAPTRKEGFSEPTDDGSVGNSVLIVTDQRLFWFRLDTEQNDSIDLFRLGATPAIDLTGKRMDGVRFATGRDGGLDFFSRFDLDSVREAVQALRSGAGVASGIGEEAQTEIEFKALQCGVPGRLAFDAVRALGLAGQDKVEAVAVGFGAGPPDSRTIGDTVLVVGSSQFGWSQPSRREARTLSADELASVVGLEAEGDLPGLRVRTAAGKSIDFRLTSGLEQTLEALEVLTGGRAAPADGE